MKRLESYEEGSPTSPLGKSRNYTTLTHPVFASNGQASQFQESARKSCALLQPKNLNNSHDLTDFEEKNETDNPQDPGNKNE